MQLLEEMANRHGAAAAAGTLDSPRSQMFVFDRLLLDELGWKQATHALGSAFEVLSQEQTDAKVRLESDGGRAFLLIVELGGFVLPGAAETCSRSELPVARPAGDALLWGSRIAKVFSDRRNLAIIDAVNREALSPSELFARIGGASVEGFDRRCKMLANLGWILKVEETGGGPGRGANRNLYRATVPEVSPTAVWNGIPPTARQGECWSVFERFCTAALEAVRAGTFNSRTDRHLTLATLLVDEAGWRQVMESLATCRDTIARIRQEAAARLAARDARGWEAGVLIAGFEGPLVKRR